MSGLENIDSPEQVNAAPKVEELSLTNKDKKLIQERYFGTDFALEDFQALKELTGKKFDNTIKMYGRKEEDGEWDEGSISKEDLNYLTDWLAALKINENRDEKEVIADIRGLAVDQYGSVLKLVDAEDGEKVPLGGQEVVEEEDVPGEATLKIEDGEEQVEAGLEYVKDYPHIQEYLATTRSVVRGFLGAEFRDDVSAVFDGIEGIGEIAGLEEIEADMSTMFSNAELFSEVLTDRQIDNISLGFLGEALEGLESNWESIEGVVDKVMQDLPMMMEIYTQNEDKIDQAIEQATQAGVTDLKALQLGATMDIDMSSVDFSSRENYTPPAELMTLMENFSKAPRLMSDLVEKRTHAYIEKTYSDVTYETATKEQKQAGMTYAMSMFDDYAFTKKVIDDMMNGGTFDMDTYLTSPDMPDTAPTPKDLKGLEEDMGAMIGKAEELGEKVQNGLGGKTLADAFSGLNKFARAMGEKSFLSWMKKSPFGQFLLGILAFVEEMTGKKIGGGVEAIMRRDEFDLVIDNYTKLDKRDKSKNRGDRGLGSNNIPNLSKVSVATYTTKEEGAEVVYQKSKTGVLRKYTKNDKGELEVVRKSGLETTKVEDLKDEDVEIGNLSELVAGDVNMHQLSSSIYTNIADGKKTTLFSILHGVTPNKTQLIDTHEKMIMSYTKTELPSLLKSKGDGIALDEATIVKLLVNNILDRKEAYVQTGAAEAEEVVPPKTKKEDIPSPDVVADVVTPPAEGDESSQ